MSSEIEWRWADPQGQQRLVRVDELRAALAGGVIAPNTPVWRRGWGGWKPAYEVPELSSSASANGATLNIPPPPLFIVAVQHEYEDKSAIPDPPASHEEPPPPPRYFPSAVPAPEVPKPPPDAVVASPAQPPAPAQAPVAAQNQVILFSAVPTPAQTISTARLKAALPQPPTLAGLSDLSPPPSVPHSASPAAGAAPVETTPIPPRPSSFPPDDAGWDVGSDSVKAVPRAAPSETIAGALAPPHLGNEANTAVDITKLSVADAERILAGGPAHRTVVGVPAIAQSALPPPPPLQPASAAPSAPPVPAKVLTPRFGSAAEPSPTSGRSRPPPPLRKRGQTLMLYGGAPRESEGSEAKPSEAPPIKVPGPGVQAPKAVTQAPPWTDSKLEAIPKLPPPPVPPIRPMMDSIEEISGSVILAEDSGADVTARRQKIEDLSGSHLLPDASGSAPQITSPALPPRAGPTTTLRAEPAPPPPPVADMVSAPPVAAALPESTVGSIDDDAVADPFPPVAPTSPSRRIVHDLNEVWHQPRKRRIAAYVAASTVALAGVVALIARLAGGSRAGDDDAVAAARSGVSAVAYQPPSGTGDVPPTRPTEMLAPGVAPAIDVPCTLAGPAHVVSPKAQVRTGVETAAAQNRIALGFVTGDKDGLAVVLEPGSLSAVTTARQHSHEPIRRLVPQLGSGKGVVAVADADRKGERIAGARTVAGEGLFVLGAADGKLVWAARSTDVPHPIWALEGEGAVEALRAVPLEDGGYAVAFRQGQAIYLGALGPDKSANGALSRMTGLGPQIGSPALGASGAKAMAAWADRAATNDPWMLRYVRWRPGQAAGEAQSFTIPPGGMGEQAMSPGLTGLPGGRFLLAWTEGQVSSHQVRAQTLATSGEALGAPLTISGEGVNAGQGQPAVLPDGRGLVVYLASPAGATAQVVATPLACPLSPP